MFIERCFLLILKEIVLHDAGLSFIGKSFRVEEFGISRLNFDCSVEICPSFIKSFQTE